jgi:hypothetical protein
MNLIRNKWSCWKVHVCIYEYICVRMYMNRYIYMYTYTYMYIYMPMKDEPYTEQVVLLEGKYLYIYINIYVRIYMNIYMYTYIYIYIYIYICIYTYIYMPITDEFYMEQAVLLQGMSVSLILNVSFLYLCLIGWSA